MQQLLDGLKAAAEPTRLRVLALCALGELSVTELTQILAQSQPRVSRHLKLLCDAGLLERHREGNWVFHRIGPSGEGAALARALVEQISPSDPELALDLKRLETIRKQRAAAASAYFRRNARKWDEIRTLHVDDREVERMLLGLMPRPSVEDLLDVGTGTGRILELLGPHATHAVGIDLSREMLAVARDKLGRAGLGNCAVRQADMYSLPFQSESMDLVTIHQVLHFAERPAAVVAEAARVLRDRGRMLIVDFARHDLEYLRTDHAHRRLGFTEDEVVDWCADHGLRTAEPLVLSGRPLSVTIWSADKAPQRQIDKAPTRGMTGRRRSAAVEAVRGQEAVS